MFKEYATKKESGGNIVINLDRVEFFRPGREHPTDFMLSGVDVWMMSGAKVWIDYNYEDFITDIELNRNEKVR